MSLFACRERVLLSYSRVSSVIDVSKGFLACFLIETNCVVPVTIYFFYILFFLLSAIIPNNISVFNVYMIYFNHATAKYLQLNTKC